MRPLLPLLLIGCVAPPAALPDAALPVPDETFTAWGPGDGMTFLLGPGDLNGDGYADLLVGGGTVPSAHDYRIVTFVGGLYGIAREPDSEIYEEAVGQTTRAGDLDGDGSADVIARQTLRSTWAIWYASTGLGPPSGVITSQLPDPALLNSQEVVTPADFNGDGFDDLPLHEVWWDNATRQSGALTSIWAGSPQGIGPSPTWQLPDTYDACASVGDLDGDGYDELASGQDWYDGAFPASGRITVWFGSPNGPDPLRTWDFTGDQANARLKLPVGIGDVNGDGYGDLAVIGGNHGTDYDHFGAPVRFDTIRMLVFHGGPAGLPAVPALDLPYPGQNTVLESPDAAGDVNGDGYDDMVLVGGTSNAKEGWLLLGSATGLQSTPWWTLPNAQTATGLGDVNGDGLDDVALIRRYGFDWRPGEGVVDVVQGLTDPAADDDNDGTPNLDDCADHDPARHPGAAEIWSDDFDQNCDGYDRTFALRAPGSAATGSRQDAFVTPAQPGDVVRLFMSTYGRGIGGCAPSNGFVCRDIMLPSQIAMVTATAAGPLRVPFRMPAGGRVWLQATLQATNGSVAVSDIHQVGRATP